MAPSQIRITGARITPIAFVDPPLLNTVGVHEPFALRAIIQLDTDAGLVGLGETYADQTHLARLQAAADAITGLDVFALNAIRAAIDERLRGDSRAVGTAGMITTASAVDQVLSPFEVACLDVQGHATGRPVSDLLGGKVRDAVPFSAYLFYKWACHPGAEPDAFGEALDPDGIVAQARRIIDEYGFTAIKLKGGVFPPEEEMAAIEALHAAFPDHPLRLDPNAAWTPQTSVKVASGLAGILDACDTHWPWKTEEIVKPGALKFVDGAVAVPTTPGLGVEIDEDALATLHEQYVRCGIRDRDDTGYMKTIDPSYEAVSPRW